MKNTFEYRGIYFSENTPLDLCDKLIELRNKRQRLVFDFGNTETKTSWNELHDISGYIGKTTGTKPSLILVYNTRSRGGGILLTNCIISIKTSKGKSLIYKL